MEELLKLLYPWNRIEYPFPNVFFAGNEKLSKDLLSSVNSINSNDTTELQCSGVMDKLQKCICNYELCLSWYPCALKYCDNQGEGGETVSYRCGIKTCGKCRQFQFFVDKQEDCFWNMPVFDDM